MSYSFGAEIDEPAGVVMQPIVRKLSIAVLLATWGLACECSESGIRGVAPRIVAEPNPLAFGPAYVGLAARRVLKISNAGDAALVVSSIELVAGSHPGLTVAGAQKTLATGESFDVEVVLTVTEPGPVSGAISISSNDPETPVLEVPITAEGARRPGPAISVCVAALGTERCADPLSHDFGAVPTGASVEATIIVTSAGDQPLLLESAAAASGAHPSFAFAPEYRGETLAPDERRMITVTFAPADEQAVSAVFQVISSDPERDLVPIVFTGGGIRAALCADPAAIDFGVTPVGVPVERTVTLTACGPAPIELRSLEAGPSAELALAMPFTTPVTLAPGEALEAVLRYTPVDRGTDNGMLRAITGAGEVQVPLTGRTAECDLTATPVALSFGGVGAGRSRRLPVLVENAGAADCTLSGAAITGGTGELTLPSPPAVPRVLTPGSSLTIDVEYSPQGAGMDTAVLSILSDDPLEPSLDVPLSGRQLEAGECELVAQPDPVAFGSVSLGTTRTLGVQITNNGQTACGILQVRMSSSSSPDFNVFGGPPIPLLRAGGSFTADVTFEPSSTGLQTGTIEIVTSIRASAPPSVIGVNGSGSGAKLCVTPNPVIFGTHPVSLGVTRQVILTSCGTDALVVGGLALPAPTSAEYSLPQAPAVPLTIPAGASVTVNVAYRGTAAGRDDGVLRVTSNDALLPATDIELIAAAGEGCGDVQGKICGLGGSGPVSGATVYVDTPGGRVSTTTNGQGDFVLTCLPAGGWTVHAESGSWNTDFTTTVSENQVTQVPGQQCLDPQSARVAVVWGEWDSMEAILYALNVPITFYDETQVANLLLDPAELARHDIVFLNCGFPETMITLGAGLQNIRDFVMNGGSVYASDWAYDALEVAWPSFVDYYQDDSVLDDAQDAGNFRGPANILDPTLRAALGGRSQVTIDSCCTGIEGAAAPATVYLAADRYNDGGSHPLFVGFKPSMGSGTVMYTDFHNTGQSHINDLFRWLITRL